MNLSKSFEFLDPGTCKGRIHIIGCGSVGSTVAELLARFGFTNFSLYDMDTVMPHNMVNQMFTVKHVGMKKVDAVQEILCDINPENARTVKLYPNGWKDQPLDGYVFLCVDNIETRRDVVNGNMYNTFIKGMFDFRTGLTDGQHFAADWSDLHERKAFLNTMNFTHEQAKANQHLSACNVSLCVAPTVRMIANAGVANFINLIKGEHMYRQVMTDAFKLQIEPIG